MKRLLTACILIFSVTMLAGLALAQQSSQPIVSPEQEHPLTASEVREYLRLSGAGEIYRAGWIASLDKVKSKAPPYWPASLWIEMKLEMQKADLTPMVLEAYSPYISGDMMQTANDFLKTKSMEELKATDFGQELCAREQRSDAQAEALTLKLTVKTLGPILARHDAELKAVRAKYIAAHPNYKD